MNIKAAVMYPNSRIAGLEHVDYGPLFITVSFIMTVSVIVMFVTVRERELTLKNQELENKHPEWNLATQDSYIPIGSLSSRIGRKRTILVGVAILAGYKGPYVIESFDPRALMEVRKISPDIAVGQLSQDFVKNREGLPLWQAIILKNMMFNIKISPDFIFMWRKGVKLNTYPNLCFLCRFG